MSDDQTLFEETLRAAVESDDHELAQSLAQKATRFAADGGTTASIYERECEYSKSCICYSCQRPKPAQKMHRLRGEPHCPGCYNGVWF